MASIAEKKEEQVAGIKFDSLASYKRAFFEDALELSNAIVRLNRLIDNKEDDFSDWVEIRSRLETIAINIERKIIAKMVS